MRRVAPGLVLALLATLVGLLVPGPAVAQRPGSPAERRVALVVGNAAYPDAALRNPVNDARAMAAALRRLGFEVIAHENTTQRQLQRAIGDFGRRLSGGAVGLFFYAGHGIQVNGRNYLIPVDAVIQVEADVTLEGVDLDRVLEQVKQNPLNIVILDACRNNPFERRWRSAGGGGLAAVLDAPAGTLIAYATAPGKVASDGEGANGVYTSELLQAIESPGLRVEDVFKRVRAGVAQRTRSEQVPWEVSSLTGDFYFRTAPAPAPPPPVTVAARPPVPAPPAAPGPTLDAPSPEARECDTLAGILEPTVPGSRDIPAELIDGARAVAACRAAVERHPQLPRYQVAYSRALHRTSQDAEALVWLRRAVEAGHARAQANLGWVHANGRGLPRNEAEAARWYRRAAEQGDPAGQTSLGAMLRDGHGGLARDDKEAVRLFRLAAEQGYGPAQSVLGFMYANGRGVTRDDAEAVRWYRRAAEQGVGAGQYNLGFMYEQGRGGLSRDDAEAVRLYRLAAAAGNAWAQSGLGFMYEQGRGGLARDAEAAVRLYRQAAGQGNELGKRHLARACGAAVRPAACPKS